MRVFCLDDDTQLAQIVSAERFDPLEFVLQQRLTSNDVVIINMAAPDDFRGSTGDVPWTSKWTKAIEETRRAFRGVIIVVHRVTQSEAARRLYDALAAPGIPPIQTDKENGEELLDAWQSAGVVFVQEPLSVDAFNSAVSMAAQRPKETISNLQFRLQLIETFSEMRGAWHHAQNRAAALRIIGGAVLCWIEDVANHRQTLRGVAPAKALEALRQWRNAQRRIAPPSGLEEDDSALFEDDVLGPLIEVLLRLDREKGRKPDPMPGKRFRQAILIDDEARSCGWLWILRCILRERFNAALSDESVETDFGRTLERLRQKDSFWLDDKHLVLLDVAFPSRPLGGLTLLDHITRAPNPVPVIVFSAKTSGFLVRRVLNRRTSYFFKEYGDDRSAIDYYLHLEEMISEALSQTPRLVASHRWLTASEEAASRADSAIEKIDQWVQQGLGLLNRTRFSSNAVGTSDLAIIRAGTALEQMLEATQDSLIHTHRYLPDVPPVSDSVSMKVYVREDLVSLRPSQKDGRSEWYFDQSGLSPSDRMRIECGWLVRRMRNAVAHARLSPRSVGDIEALAVFLALSYFTAGGSANGANSRRTYGPVYDYLATDDFQANLSAPRKGDLFDWNQARMVTKRILSRWNKTMAESFRWISQIVRSASGPEATGNLPSLALCAILAGPLEAYAQLTYVNDIDASVVAELCWRLVAEIDLSLVCEDKPGLNVQSVGG